MNTLMRRVAVSVAISALAVERPLTQRNAQVLADRVTDAVRSPLHTLQTP